MMIFCSWILPDYVLGQLDNSFRPLADEALQARLEVNVKNVNFLASYRDLGPVQVGAQRLDLPVVPEVAEGDAAPGALQHGLVAVVAPHEHRGCQLGLVAHHDVRPLFVKELVQVLLLLGGVDASDVPHQDR